MSKRAWLVFAAIQTTGSILASYGTVHSESAFVRVSWLVGFLLLLPGNIPAMAVGQTLLHVRSAYIFFPIAIACNVILWLTCSAVWRIVRRGSQGTSYTYSISFAAVGLVFAILNTVHFLRPLRVGTASFLTECLSRSIMMAVTLAETALSGEDSQQMWAASCSPHSLLVALGKNSEGKSERVTIEKSPFHQQLSLGWLSGFTISCMEEVQTEPSFSQRKRFAIGRLLNGLSNWISGIDR